MSQDSLEKLMLNYAEGDIHAFHKIYAQNSAKIYGLIKTNFNIDSRAREVYTKIWMDLHHARHDFTLESKFESWLQVRVERTIAECLEASVPIQDSPGPKDPPPDLTQEILDAIETHIDPELLRSLPRFLAPFTAIAAMTLAFCPQFGIGPLFGGGFGVANFIFERSLAQGAVFCGALYMLLSTLAGALFLTVPELRTVYRRSLWVVPLIVALSLLILMGIGFLVEGITPLYLPTYVTIWTASAILMGRLVLRLSYMVRVR